MLRALRGSCVQLGETGRPNINKLSTVCLQYVQYMISYGVEPLDESPEVTRLGVSFRVARMVFTVSQNDCAANGPKVSYAVPCGRKIYRKPESSFANYAKRE